MGEEAKDEGEALGGSEAMGEGEGCCFLVESLTLPILHVCWSHGYSFAKGLM